MDLGDVIEHARAVTGRSFATRDLEAGERDGLWVVRIAGDLMAYVAKDAASQKILARERKVVARLATRVSFRIPKPVGPIALEGDIDLREPVPGATGPAHHARALGDPVLLPKVAAWMGSTMRELHDALTRGEIGAFGLGAPLYPASAARMRTAIEAVLEGDERARAAEIVIRWEERLANIDPRDDVAIHADFGSHNFAWDEATGLPTGVYDFHEIARAPAWFDLKYLSSYGETALRVALDAYGAGDRAALDDVRLVHAVTALDDLVWHHEDPGAHKTRTTRGREGMLGWVRDAAAAALKA